MKREIWEEKGRRKTTNRAGKNGEREDDRGKMACGTPSCRRTRSENAVPRILSQRLHLYLSPIRLYGIYPSVFPRGIPRATCAGKGRE